MKLFLARGAAAAILSLATFGSPLAHVRFDSAQAPSRSMYRAVLRVPHGCGGQPTLKLRVDLPDGVGDVRPEPKAGWSVDLTRRSEADALPGADGNRTTTTPITWQGVLAPDEPGEFPFRMRIADGLEVGRILYFPVVQDCAKGREAWAQIPDAGQDPHGLDAPTPRLTVVAAPAETSTKAGSVTVEQPWSRATPHNAKVGGGYIRILNTGSAPDRLIGASFVAAGRVEIHEMSLDGTVMRMKPVVGGLEIKPGEAVELKPGGHHLMFMDLKQPLKEGQKLQGTLVFEKAGTVDVTYVVRPLGGQAPGPAEHKH